MLTHLISRLFKIAIMRAGPDQLPASNFLLTLCLGAWLIERLLLAPIEASVNEFSTFTAISVHIAYALLISGFFYAVLTKIKLKSRFLQTITAFFGCEAIIDLTGFIGHAFGLKTPVGALLYTVDIIWCIALIGFLIHKSCNVSKIEGYIHGIIVYLFVIAIISSTLI